MMSLRSMGGSGTLPQSQSVAGWVGGGGQCSVSLLLNLRLERGDSGSGWCLDLGLPSLICLASSMSDDVSLKPTPAESTSAGSLVCSEMREGALECRTAPDTSDALDFLCEGGACRERVTRTSPTTCPVAAPHPPAEGVQHSDVGAGTEDLVVVLLSVRQLQLVDPLL